MQWSEDGHTVQVPAEHFLQYFPVSGRVEFQQQSHRPRPFIHLRLVPSPIFPLGQQSFPIFHIVYSYYLNAKITRSIQECMTRITDYLTIFTDTAQHQQEPMKVVIISVIVIQARKRVKRNFATETTPKYNQIWQTKWI